MTSIDTSVGMPLDHERPASGLLGLAERGLLPDALIRHGMRRLCRQRLREESAGGAAGQAERFHACLDGLARSPVAIHVDAANRQHYELPAEFFHRCLGPRLKYSCCFFPEGTESLAAAEDAMLALCDERADLADGQSILELGCGWGSWTLWMAEKYPHARIVAVSNSSGQRRFIEARCREKGLDNVRVITCDVNTLELDAAQFDRCVSIEMFEHVRNYATLMRRIGDWLRPGGKLFVHLFAHRTLMYPFETDGADNWMGRHFFTGGMMPSTDTLLWFQQGMAVEQRWLLDGRHYQRSAERWLLRQDEQREAIMKVLQAAYGDTAGLWFQRWRMFWMACAELFGLADGQEWMVAHYRFVRPATAPIREAGA